METIIFNLGKNVRHEKLEGQDHLVVPMVMLTEGVHNGSRGPLYYPKEELVRWAPSWNYKPIVVYHPTRNGKGASACHPDVLNTRKVGVVLNTEFKNGKLRAEAWLNVDQLSRIDSRILENVENGKLTEVSTGLWTEDERKEGEWNGEKYGAIARNFKPDHLAILPDERGACSIADGAGLLQMNMEKMMKGRSRMTAKEIKAMRYFSHKERRSMSTRDFGDPRKRAFPIKTQRDLENAARLIGHAGNPEAVKRRLIAIAKRKGLTIPTSWTKNQEKHNPDNNLSNTPQENAMKTIKEYVDHLIENGWEEADRDALTTLAEKKVKADPNFLTKLKVPAPVNNKEEEKKETKEEEKKVPVLNTEEEKDKKPLTPEEWLQNSDMPPEIREALRSSLSVQNQEKDKLIGTITSNKRNKFSKEYLATRSLEELAGIAALATAETAKTAPLYSGAAAGGTPPTENAHKEVPLKRTVMKFGDKSAA